jgi:hypothetical protein
MKNKIEYIIATPYGNYYELSKEGYVIKYSNGLNKENASVEELKTWQVLGIVEIKPFGHIGRLIPLSEAVNIESFSFKNRKPKYTIVDLDHNTKRIMGNVKYHGVRKIYKPVEV